MVELVQKLIQNTELKKLAFFLKALGNPTRLKILFLVANSEKPLHIKAVVKKLGMDYAATYRHIKMLEKAQIIKIFEVGRSRVLAVNKSREIFQVLDYVKKCVS